MAKIITNGKQQLEAEKALKTEVRELTGAIKGKNTAIKALEKELILNKKAVGKTIAEKEKLSVILLGKMSAVQNHHQDIEDTIDQWADDKLKPAQALRKIRGISAKLGRLCKSVVPG